jgi:hypothetical protein
VNRIPNDIRVLLKVQMAKMVEIVYMAKMVAMI